MLDGCKVGKTPLKSMTRSSEHVLHNVHFKAVSHFYTIT